jgi:hypothetical protein
LWVKGRIYTSINSYKIVFHPSRSNNNTLLTTSVYGDAQESAI